MTADALPLLPFLASCALPAFLLPAIPLLDALDVRRANRRDAKRQKRPNTASPDRLAMPGVNGSDEDGENAVLASFLVALQPEWANDAWRSWSAGASTGGGAPAGPATASGKGKGPSKTPASEAMVAGGSSNGPRRPAVLVDALAGCDVAERSRLLARLLDILSDDDEGFISATRQPIPLSTISVLPTLLPSRTHFVVMATSVTPPVIARSSQLVYSNPKSDRKSVV